MRPRTPFRPYWFLLLASLLAHLAGCHEAAQSKLPTTQMQIGGQAFTLEIAADEPSRNYGLMNRDSMPEEHGMIFVFQTEEPLAFYMKNTRFDLDIIYLNTAGKVVSIGHMQSCDLQNTPSGGPARYAIELNRGVAAKVGVQGGDVLKIPPDVQAKIKG